MDIDMDINEHLYEHVLKKCSGMYKSRLGTPRATSLDEDENKSWSDGL